MAVSMGERAEEGSSGAPVAGAAWPVVSVAGQTEGGTPKASFADVAIGEASVSMSPAPSIARGAALEELPPQERSALLEVSAGMSWSLVRVATLDEAAEERE